MDEPVEVLRHVVNNLNDLEIEYFLIGPTAAAQPVRVTKNINIMINLETAKIKDFLNRFVLDRYTCPHYEILFDDVKSQNSFTFFHEKSKVKITFDIRKNTDIALSEFSRKKLLQVESDFAVYAATVEDVIIKKLVFYSIAPSPIYISDIRRLIYHNEIDQAYLDTWIDKLALSMAWERASKN